MSQKENVQKPLQGKEIEAQPIRLRDMPSNYVMIDRDKSFQSAVLIFSSNPSAKSLMILYSGTDSNGEKTIRSAYQSPATFADHDIEHPDDNHEYFYHAAGEKLVKLEMEVALDVTNYGQTYVMVPEGAVHEEIREAAKNRVNNVLDRSRIEDEINFSEDWSCAEALRITRVTHGTSVVTRGIPVEYNSSKVGSDVLSLLKSVEKGASMPPEVFMLAVALEAQKSAGVFRPDFIGKLETLAMAASESAIYSHMCSNMPLAHAMILADSHGDIIKHPAGSLLRGTPESPVEYHVYQEIDENGDRIGRYVLAGEVILDTGEKGMHSIDSIESREMNIYGYYLNSAFKEQFVPVTGAEADGVLVKHFGYQRPAHDESHVTNSMTQGVVM